VLKSNSGSRDLAICANTADEATRRRGGLIRADDLKIAARCGFVTAYLDRHLKEGGRVV
jgi:hypothetical protein